MAETPDQLPSCEPVPPATHSETGVDISLLKERLKLTVTERWERNLQAIQAIEAFREAGRARRADAAAPTDRTQR